MSKISCIIPAYNEGPRIENVLKAVYKHPLVDEIIVVDDDSQDNTKDIVRKFKGVRLIVNEKNVGKSCTVATGVIHSKGDIIILLDADLIGLTPKNISDLIEPVLSGIADISISLRGNAPWIYRDIIRLDFISGERVFAKQLILDKLDEIRQLAGFGLEVYLNRLIIKNHYRIKIVPWKNVSSPWKYKKMGWWQGIKGEIIMNLKILRTVSIFEIVRQIAKMSALRVKQTYANDIKLSFVIPAYNEDAVLGQCLRSVIEKSEGYNTEIIVVNNASTDNTRKIAEKFKKVKIVDEPRKGLVFARQAGYLASSGDLIANLDADAALGAGWVDTVLSEFAKDKRLVALSGPIVYHDMPGYVGVMVKIFFRVGFLGNLMGGAVLQGGNYIVRKTALEQVGGYDLEADFFTEDVITAKRMSKIGKVKFIMKLPMGASGRRLAAEGVTRTGFRAAINYIWVVFFGKPFKRTGERDIRPQTRK